MAKYIITIENILGEYAVTVLNDNLKEIASEHHIKTEKRARTLAEKINKMMPDSIVRRKSGTELSIL